MSRPYRLLALFWALIIYFGATMSCVPPDTLRFSYSDKVAHFGAYALLSWFVYKAFGRSPERKYRTHAGLYALVIGVVYGAGLELYQQSIAYRCCSSGDFIANCLGVVAVVGYMRWQDG
jgi:VanZ family protein